MKGAIAACLRDLVVSKFGNKQWEASLAKAGLPKGTIFLASQDVEDAAVMRVVGAVCSENNLTLSQAADAFGEYWVSTYAAKVYKTHYYGVTSAKQFLLRLDEVHRITTETIPNAKPPRFDYEWLNEKTLVMRYKSHRGMIDFFVGLVKGVGKHFREDIKVSKTGADRIQIIFSK